MPLEKEDAALLWDMLRHARRVVETLEELTYEQYRVDENLRLATERRLEIIGEAARRVSSAFEAAHPEIPWQRIVAHRHVLAHDYDEIIDERIWRVATIHIPTLIEQLKPLVPEPPASPEEA